VDQSVDKKIDKKLKNYWK